MQAIFEIFNEHWSGRIDSLELSDAFVVSVMPFHHMFFKFDFKRSWTLCRQFCDYLLNSNISHAVLFSVDSINWSGTFLFLTQLLFDGIYFEPIFNQYCKNRFACQSVVKRAAAENLVGILSKEGILKLFNVYAKIIQNSILKLNPEYSSSYLIFHNTEHQPLYWKANHCGNFIWAMRIGGGLIFLEWFWWLRWL